MDLGEDVYTPDYGNEAPRLSMKSLLKRPNRHMMDEARYTDRNLENTMRQPLRRRPIEFVKAQEVYDPSKDLMEKLKLGNKQENLVEEMQLLQVEPQPLKLSDLRDDEGSEVEISDGEEIEAETDDGNADVDDLDEERRAEIVVESETPEIPDEHKGVEEEPVNIAENAKEDATLEIGEVRESVNDQNETEILGSEADMDDVEIHDEVQDSDDEELEKKLHEELDEDSDNENVDDSDADDSVDDEEIASFDEYDDDMSDGFILDDEADEDILQTHNVAKLSTKQVIQQLKAQTKVQVTEKLEVEVPVAHLEHDPYLTVGKVMLRTHQNDDGTLEASIPQGNVKKSDKGFKELSPEFYEEESEDTDEEAAFEDYMAQVMEANLMDDDFDFGTDEDDSENDNGGDNNDILNSDEEGLEEILSFARNQKKSFSMHDMEPTQTLKKKGKGKNLRLDISDEIEMELRADLMEQFQYQRQSRKLKKMRKKEKLHEEAVAKNDLSIKYDYMLHIKEIKEEFESLLHDASRELMSFPPLDGHGNKTLSKLAKLYNMKCIRCGGNGLLMYMKIAKVRKTFHYLPDYNQISYIMRQRPVFKRSDVKTRPKEEIQDTDGKKSRHGPKNDAYVKEGDIVGGQAPEIGANNIGRQLLERLGWVKGEGLGAHGNKGISEPLLATVKKSKTGLK